MSLRGVSLRRMTKNLTSASINELNIRELIQDEDKEGGLIE
jgi:hypothetical protein